MMEHNIISGEFFRPAADVINNLINKISNVAGYIATPKGKRKDKEEAVAFFIEEIKNNAHMPPIAKAAAISNARSMIKEYINQNDIINLALEQLSDDATPENIDDDWIENFLNKAKSISNDDMKRIFAKILAVECNRNKSISKQLLNILSIISSDIAVAFRRICQYTVLEKSACGRRESRLFITSIADTKEHHIDVTFVEIEELSNIGLINYSGLTDYITHDDIVEFRYGKSIYKINECPDSGCMVGHVALTRAGCELANIFEQQFIEEYEDEIEMYLKSNGFKIERIVS